MYDYHTYIRTNLVIILPLTTTTTTTTTINNNNNNNNKQISSRSSCAPLGTENGILLLILADYSSTYYGYQKVSCSPSFIK